MESTSKRRNFEVLSKYTELPFLIDFLQTKKLTILSPSYWDDKNDSSFLFKYSEIKNIKSILAFCLTAETETYHHWKVFCPGKSGVRIEFDKQSFIEWASQAKNIKSDYVKYQTIEHLAKFSPHIDDLPFIKRYPYRHEKEYRVIFEDAEELITSKQLNIKLSLVRRVVVSPWMPKSVYKSIKATIKLIPGCEDLMVHRTTLIDNEQWQKVATTLVSDNSQGG